jgi:uncharacterized membrane protein YraQ (UPF0718 family)
MVLGRVGLGFVAAMIVGWVVGERDREGFLRVVATDDLSACGCREDNAGCDCDDGHECSHHETEPRWKSFFNYFAGDFAFMGRFLIFGASVAAALQTLVPQSILGSVANTPVVSLFTMFGVGPQLAFLVFGPMMDAKLAFLYNATFSKGFLRTVIGVVTLVTLLGTLWIEVLVG